MPVEIEVHTVPHFKASINAKVEPERLECDGIFISYEVRPKLGHLLHNMGFVDSDMHTTVVKICNFFRDNNVNAIIGMDSNSWSPFWGSKSSNPRGIELETFCIQNNLVVLNKGSVPTIKTI